MNEVDQISRQVMERIEARSLTGQNKYGKSVERDDLTRIEWLRHAQEEALDLAVYLERLITDFSRLEDDGK